MACKYILRVVSYLKDITWVEYTQWYIVSVYSTEYIYFAGWIQPTSLHALIRLSIMFLLPLPFYFRTFIAFLFAKVLTIHLCRQFVFCCCCYSCSLPHQCHTAFVAFAHHSILSALLFTHLSSFRYAIRSFRHNTPVQSKYTLYTKYRPRMMRHQKPVSSLSPSVPTSTTRCTKFMPFKSKTPSDFH